MALGETKEKGVEIFLTLVEIATAITAIILAATALQQAVGADPCEMRDYNATLANQTTDNSATNGNGTSFFDETCFVMSDIKQICCGRDKGAVLINAGVLQLSGVVFVLLSIRLIVTVWRCCEVRREERLHGGGPLASTKGSINAGGL
jgi:hypothetical protein